MLTTTLALAALLATPPAGPAPAAAQAREPVRVVATLPVYASLAKEIGGAEVSVMSIADPGEDAHFVRPKPSFALELKRADLFITTGLDLELWVPTLLDKAGNPDVLEGGRGYVSAHDGITLLDIPTAADRAAGDVHIFGNPHIHTDPLRALQVARNIAAGLTRVAPDRRGVWEANLASFEDRLHKRLFGERLVAALGGPTLERLALSGGLDRFLASQQYQGRPLTGMVGGWLKQAEPLKGQRILCYHKSWAYFEERFGIVCADYVEAKPGIPPTPRHVASLVELMRGGVKGVLAESYFDRDKVDAVAERGGATAGGVPAQTGAPPVAGDYFGLIDLWIGSLSNALGGVHHP
ncbi:MAG: zinc ABC transporter substrate-binding protein [Gemmatimonadetes bacterium]|nr:zinc ABC transporter substrate-binding protein [Gemmatimonadota bacterium]